MSRMSDLSTCSNSLTHQAGSVHSIKIGGREGKRSRSKPIHLRSHNVSQGRGRRKTPPPQRRSRGPNQPNPGPETPTPGPPPKSKLSLKKKKQQPSEESLAQGAEQVGSMQTVQSATEISRPAPLITKHQSDPERPVSEWEDSLPPGQEFPGVEELQTLSQVSLESSVDEEVLAISDNDQFEALHNNIPPPASNSTSASVTAVLPVVVSISRQFALSLRAPGPAVYLRLSRVLLVRSICISLVSSGSGLSASLSCAPGPVYLRFPRVLQSIAFATLPASARVAMFVVLL
ncbi:hypothetical protein WMY93_012057 [Mugilogobius chulae]|uniref:Uncharacterized protein n=1 Tax=Mugilogobius chulae TaxID=88201 RepID=A0AAW0PA44_9GOBI